jgi:glutaryl-CoA dehydrogenase
MHPINEFGTDGQKEKYLSRLGLCFGILSSCASLTSHIAQGQIIGAFVGMEHPRLKTFLTKLKGLTEPNHGSDPAGLETTAEEVDGGFIINGSKTWISNAPVA